MYFVATGDVKNLLAYDYGWITVSTLQNHPEEFSKVSRYETLSSAQMAAAQVPVRSCRPIVLTEDNLRKRLKKKKLSLDALCSIPPAAFIPQQTIVPKQPILLTVANPVSLELPGTPPIPSLFSEPDALERITYRVKNSSQPKESAPEPKRPTPEKQPEPVKENVVNKTTTAEQKPDEQKNLKDTTSTPKEEAKNQSTTANEPKVNASKPAPATGVPKKEAEAVVPRKEEETMYFVLRNSPNPQEIYAKNGQWISFKKLSQNIQLLEEVCVFQSWDNAAEIKSKFTHNNSSPNIYKKASFVKQLTVHKLPIENPESYPFVPVDKPAPASKPASKPAPRSASRFAPEPCSDACMEFDDVSLFENDPVQTVTNNGDKPLVIRNVCDTKETELQASVLKMAAFLLDLKKNLPGMCRKKNEEIHAIDRKRLDLLHLCEFYRFSAAESCHFTAALHDASVERRSIKNELDVLTAMQQLLRHVDEKALQNVLDVDEKHSKRVYAARELSFAEAQEILVKHPLT